MSRKLSALGLVEVTSQRQADNGTVCYHDPITKCDYLSYESGYVRRSYKYRSWQTGKIVETIYQLNKQRQVKEYSKFLGRETSYTKRVLEPNVDVRFDMIARAAVNYRNTVKSYQK